MEVRLGTGVRGLADSAGESGSLFVQQPLCKCVFKGVGDSRWEDAGLVRVCVCVRTIES